MKKQFVKLLLLGAMVFTLTACGGGTSNTNPPAGNQPSNSQSSNTNNDKKPTNNNSGNESNNSGSNLLGGEQIDLTDLITVNVASTFNGNIPLPICKDTELSDGATGAGNHVYYIRRIEGSSTGMGKNYDEVFSLCCTQGTQNIDAATALEKITNKYNTYSKDSDYTNVEIFGDASTAYIATIADEAEIFKNGVYWQLKQRILIYDASSSTTYPIDITLIKSTELFGEDVIETSVKPYMEKIHDTLEQLCK